jgi:His-Xaa-Ser system protein HxsD
MKKVQGSTQSSLSTLELQVSTKLYPLESIMSAAYHFIDDYYVKLDPGKDQADLIITFSGKTKKSAKEIEKTSGELENTILAEALRLKISKRSKSVRESILNQAIASAMSPVPPEPEGIQEQDRQQELLDLDEELKKIIQKTSTMSFEDDPLGISVPITEDGQDKIAHSGKTKTATKKTAAKSKTASARAATKKKTGASAAKKK